ncbi:transporter substrate-binding domain-containing protein [Marinobacter sp. CHS3-4]|uniref:substrate-binding periplasmic protein n=1 Tax=Marinobacter sp. CHS3-4 TaxID=3045174 RepID=UPI0024B5A989|nr:transporter substrate-binding domain-containing protein [Marinobacter sp. CHS3-4]MDI9244518.1 transporter substrate-binding domain-containing protein [Marinobacter sp. CHS3-4]
MAKPPVTLITFNAPPLVEVLSGKPQGGYALTVVRRIFDLADVDFQLRVYPEKRSILMAYEQPRVCTFPIDRSQERETNLHWIGPVSISRHGLYSRPDSHLSLRTLEDAKPLSISTHLGGVIGESLQGAGYRVTQTRTPELGLRMLMANRVDLWASDVRAASEVAGTAGVLLSEPALVFFTTLRSMGCSLALDPKTLDNLEKAYRQLRDSGELEELLNTHGL